MSMSPSELENLRRQYRQLRTEAVGISHEDGFNASAFDSLVLSELESKNMLQTPENWVKVAKIVCCDVVSRANEYDTYVYEYGLA